MMEVIMKMNLMWKIRESKFNYLFNVNICFENMFNFRLFLINIT